MKKILSVFLLLLLLFPSYVKADDENIALGSLRCPVSENGKSCVETKVNGIVVKTETTTQDKNIKIVKVVERTKDIGVYKVYFKVYGDGDFQQIKKDINVVLVLDASSSVTYHYNDGVKNGKKNPYCRPNIPNAAKSFARTFNNASNVYLAAIKFNEKAILLRELKNENFDSVKFGQVAVSSKINLGLKKAQNVLKNSDRQSYVVILGDGVYSLTVCNETINIANSLRSNGTTIYTIGYSDGTSGKYKQNLINIAGSEKRYYANKDLSKIENEFKKIAEEILGEIDKPGNSIKAYLTDNLGSSFTITNSLQNQKRIEVSNITKSGIETEPFYININAYSETGWHPTNDGFVLNYNDKNNNPKEIKSSVNPEVYWVQETTTIKGCSGDANLNNIKTGLVDYIGSYYEKICEEGYIDNNITYQGFKASIKVNNLNKNQYYIDPKTQKEYFNLKSGLGFPSNISISTNVRCSYVFNVEQFKNDYDNLLKKINNASSNPFELASLTKEKNEMDNLLTNYSKLNTDDLELYKDRFINQSSELTIKYDDKVIKTNFVNENNPNVNINCTNKSESIINNLKIIDNKVCHASFSKNMILENVCLDMSTGEKTECNGDNYIPGGTKIYTDFNKKFGEIYVEIKNTALNQKVNIKLEDCNYTSDLKIQFRQIENNDPFLQTYTNPKREIPKNYKNNNYNFVDVIKADIWENSNFNYRFSLSKVNIDNIKNNTSSIGVNAYLGSDCYINNDRKYVCRFLSIKENNQNFFTKVETNSFSK